MRNDPRERYRVEFDRALERGEVTPEALAKGKCEAWNGYLRAAELCVRAPEEWELERPIAWSRERTSSAPGIRRIMLATRRGSIEVVASSHLAGSEGYMLEDGRLYVSSQAMTALISESETGAPGPVAESIMRAGSRLTRGSTR